ncbi:MAG: hypothetical protein U5L96_00670 [Owenweeksia sp.]|nr:hypothetical protein [Owenweeksia sp.]
MVIDGSQIEKSKPDPEIFHKLRQQLDLEPASLVVFEDARCRH